MTDRLLIFLYDLLFEGDLTLYFNKLISFTPAPTNAVWQVLNWQSGSGNEYENIKS